VSEQKVVVSKLLDCVSISGHAPTIFDNTKKYISTSAVKVNIIDYSLSEEITYEDRPSRANLEVDIGDVIFAKMMSTKKTLLIDCKSAKNIYSTGFYSLKSKNDIICNEYLYEIIKSEYFLLQKDRYCTGATQKSLNNSGLNKIQIPLPPLPIQQKIAAILDKVSNLINERKQQIENLDLLVKARFVEMFGLINKNPNGFPIMQLSDLCDKITDGKHGGCEVQTDSDYYYVGAREIYNKKIHYDTTPQITYKDFIESYKRCNIENGDLVIVNTGATIGKTAIANDVKTNRTLLQKSVALIKTKSFLLLPVYLQYCYILNPGMYKVDSASAQPNLLLSKMKSTKIILPPLDLQTRFSDFVQQVDKSKAEMQQGLEKLEMQYNALMQKYFEKEKF